MTMVLGTGFRWPVVKPMAEDETAGTFPELARLVREISKAASSRGIANKTRLSHATAAALKKGEKVQENTLLMFATGYQTPLNPLRRAMGLMPLPVDPTATSEPAKAETTIPVAEPPREILESPDRLARLMERDTALVVRYYTGLPPDMRRGVLNSLKKMKTAADELREMTEGHVYGCVPDESDEGIAANPDAPETEGEKTT